MGAKALGGIPSWKVLSDFCNHLTSQAFGVQLEGISRKAAEGAAAARMGCFGGSYNCPRIQNEGDELAMSVPVPVKEEAEETLALWK